MSSEEVMDTSATPHEVAYPNPIDVLPHREPFLFIDRVTRVEQDLIESWRIFSEHEHFFQGHFPNRPLVPGVILIEAMAQTLAYWALHSQPDHWVLLTGIEHAKFLKQVIPNDEVRLLVQIKKLKRGLVWADAECWKNDICVCKAEIRGFLQQKQS